MKGRRYTWAFSWKSSSSRKGGSPFKRSYSGLPTKIPHKSTLGSCIGVHLAWDKNPEKKRFFSYLCITDLPIPGLQLTKFGPIACHVFEGIHISRRYFKTPWECAAVLRLLSPSENARMRSMGSYWRCNQDDHVIWGSLLAWRTNEEEIPNDSNVFRIRKARGTWTKPALLAFEKDTKDGGSFSLLGSFFEPIIICIPNHLESESS